jgi:hypothetical protein
MVLRDLDLDLDRRGGAIAKDAIGGVAGAAWLVRLFERRIDELGSSAPKGYPDKI